MFKLDEQLFVEICAKIEDKEMVILSDYEESNGRGCGAMKCSGSCGVLMR